MPDISVLRELLIVLTAIISIVFLFAGTLDLAELRLGGAAIPEPKLDPRAAAPPPARPKAEPRASEPREPVGRLKTSYTVQVASFRDRATADRLAVRLRRDRYVVTVARVVLPDAGVRYRVRVGTFKTRQDALRLADILKTKEKLDPFVALVTTDAPRL